MDKTNEQLRQEREKRIMDAVALRKPDRVPISMAFSLFPRQVR